MISSGTRSEKYGRIRVGYVQDGCTVVDIDLAGNRRVKLRLPCGCEKWFFANTFSPSKAGLRRCMVHEIGTHERPVIYDGALKRRREVAAVEGVSVKVIGDRIRRRGTPYRAPRRYRSKLAYGDRVLPITLWAELYGVSYQVMQNRFRRHGAPTGPWVRVGQREAVA